VVTVDDWAQDLSLHLLSKLDIYDSERPWSNWVHTIVVNKAITLLTTQWDKKFGLGFSPSVKCLVYTSIEGESELISTVTPELELIIYEQYMEDHRMEITYARIAELCAQFDLEFDKSTNESALESLVGVLTHTLNEMSDDDYKALPESDRLELAKLGAAVEDNSLKLKKATAKTSQKGGGTGGVKGRGIIARIHVLFKEGLQTVSEIVAVMDKEGAIFSPATVRTQVGVLRREAGLTRQAKAKTEAKIEAKTEKESKKVPEPEKAPAKKAPAKGKGKAKAKAKK
jgi:hypothetical protein